MRKKLIISLVATLCVSTLLFGCGAEESPEDMTQQQQSTEATEETTEIETTEDPNNGNHSGEHNANPEINTGDTNPGETPTKAPSLNVSGSNNQIVDSEIIAKPPTTTEQPTTKPNGDKEQQTEDVFEQLSNQEKTALRAQLNSSDKMTAPVKVENDKTGSIKYAVYYSPNSQENLAGFYYKAYFESDYQTHYLINRYTLTVAKITRAANNTVDVKVYDYKTGDEKDTTLLGSGDVLNSYRVSLTTGAIERYENTDQNNNNNNQDTTQDNTEQETTGENNTENESNNNESGDNAVVEKPWNKKVLTYTVDKDLWIIHKTNCNALNVRANMETVRSSLDYLVSANGLGLCVTCLHENATHAEHNWEFKSSSYTVDQDTLRIHRTGSGCIDKTHKNQIVKSSLSYLELHNILFRCPICLADDRTINTSENK